MSWIYIKLYMMHSNNRIKKRACSNLNIDSEFFFYFILQMSTLYF